MDHVRLNTFESTYREELERAMCAHPEDYMPGISAQVVFDRMRVAIVNGTFNKESRAFKATCKRLEIPHTYKAIKAYIEGSN